MITRAPHKIVDRRSADVRGLGVLNALLVVLVLMALLAVQALVGGTRLVFAFPGYAVLAAAGVVALLAFRAPRALPDQLCLFSSLIFFGYVLVRAAFSPVPYIARYDIYSVLAGLVLYYLTATVLTDSKTRLFLMVCLIAAALGHVIVGAIQFRYGDNWMPIPFLQRFDYGGRASGFYICPNHLAGLLEVLGIFGLSITFWSRWPVWSKLLVGYGSLMCYVGVLLTASRGGYLSVLASLLVFVLLSVRIARAAGSTLQVRIALGTLALAAMAAITIFFVIHKSDYLSTRAKNVVDNKNIRLDFWRAAETQWKTSPWLGTGSRTYLFYGRKFRMEAVQIDPVYVHNDYLQLIAEYGLAGFAVFLAFFLLHLRRGLVTARRIGPRRIALTHHIPSNAMALNLGALGAVAAYTVHSFFDFNLHIPANVLLLALVFGILANNGVEQIAEPDRGRWALTPWRAFSFLLSMALAVQVWRLAPGEYFGERARTALRDHHPLAGISFARKGLEYEQGNPQLFYNLGRAYFLAGDAQSDGAARASFYRAALPPYEAARALAPLDETYWLELAFTYDCLDRFAEAEWMFTEARLLDPRSQALRQYYEAHLVRWKGQDIPPRQADPAAAEPPG